MKTKLLMIFYCFSILIVKAQTQICPTCSCTVNDTKPSMIINDVIRLSREASYGIKTNLLEATFPNEIPMVLKDLTDLFAKTSRTVDPVSGIRVYFAQTEEKKLCVIFVPTFYKDQVDRDYENEYQMLSYGTTNLVPVSKNDKILYVQNFQKWFVKNQGALPQAGPDLITETQALFYEKASINELYKVLTGCLSSSVKGVTVKFVAYGPNESVTYRTVTRRVDKKLLIHFSFKDCNNQPFSFSSCSWTMKQDPDVDTALPCPDFCTDVIPH
jgi:hypothetical protein